MTLPNPEDCRRSAERCRREALAGAGSNERVRFSQAWESDRGDVRKAEGGASRPAAGAIWARARAP